MSLLHLVSIVHPARAGLDADRRLELLSNVEATILESAASGVRTRSPSVRRVNLPTRGRGHRSRFPSLASALTLLDPAIVHLQSDPDTPLAHQVARLARQRQFALILESEHDVCRPPEWNVWSLARSRKVLAMTSALIARTSAGLTCMRRLGFQGLGVVAACGTPTRSLPSAVEARRVLQLGPETQLLLGWVGPADLESGILDAFEAVAVCGAAVSLVVAVPDDVRQDLIDRADALEILDQVRFVTTQQGEYDQGTAASLASQPAIAGAIGALLIGPPRDRSERIATVQNVEFAQVHGIPIVYPQNAELAEVAGSGGWAVPASDPGLLARLMATLCRQPDLVRQASEAASSHAARRHSLEAAAADFDRVIHAVAASKDTQRVAADFPGKRGKLSLSFRREPSRT